MERGVWQHDPQVAVAGSDERGDETVAALAQQDDGPLNSGQQVSGSIIQSGESGNGFQVGGHDRQGFFFPMLSFSQGLNRRFILRINRQVKPAQAFDRQNMSLLEKGYALRDGVVGPDQNAGTVMKRYERSAVGACIGLGMESSVYRITVFGFTLPT